MAADPITPAVSDRICRHMNEDHADAVALYARAYGNIAEPGLSRMLSIDPEGMTLAVDQDGTAQEVRVAFDHVLTDSEDAHQTLIAMLRQARPPA